MKAAGITEPSDIDSLRREVARLREELERPGHPQRSQTLVGGEPNVQLQQVLQEQAQETQGLNEALRAERDLYINLNTQE